ncbi:hypothetical protein E4U54_003703 [Claviceps lovelessii]|nr:hypothetical protein E4U54_003703 [Claviceps lovelessii]
MLYTRIQSIIRNRPRRQRREADSAPYGMKREPINLPGVSQEEIFILREKAAASQIRILELRPESPSEYEFHKISRPSPRLRPVLNPSAGEETRPKELEARPLWY